MQRLSRFVAIFVLMTLALNLGDWPFIDELLADLNEQAQTRDGGVRSVAMPASDDRSDSREIHLGFGFQSLYSFLSVVPPPADLLVAVLPQSDEAFARLVVIAPEFIRDGPFRPPAA